MTTAIAPLALVQGAARQAAPYGLFSTFTFRGNGDRWESGVTWETLTCEPAGGIGPLSCVPGSPATPGTSEVQSVAIAGGPPTTGTFVLTVNGVASDPIPFNATAAQVNGALNNAPATAVASGGPLPASPITLTWSAKGDQPAATVSSSTLDAGAAGVTTTTPGVAPTPEGPGSLEAVGLPKSLDDNSGEIGVATPFTVYGHYACVVIGSWDDAQDLANQHLLLREEGRVEQQFWTGDLGAVPNLRDATQVLGGAPQSVADGLAYLEFVLATEYGGQGVIHMTRGMALQAAGYDLLDVIAGRLTTKTGTPVAAGSGYDGSGPTGSPALGAGQSWAYATPPIFGYRSDIFDSSARPGDLLSRSDNHLTAIAERNYLLGFDPCGVAAVLLDLNAGSAP